jgi:hypothetical protein
MSQIIDIMQRGYFPELDTYRVREKLRSFYRKTPEYKASHSIDTQPTNSTVEYRADGTTVSSRVIELSEGQEMTPEFIISAHGLDAAKWEVISYVNNFWNAQIKGGKKILMYQSKLSVRPNKKGLSFKDIDKLYAKLDRKAKPIPVSYVPKSNGLEAEVNIADLHLGKLCWWGDTDNNYDYKIAQKSFNTIINEICEELRRLPIAKITFVWANDFFNIDTITNTTTAGTPQDVDIRWPKLFDKGSELLISGILTLREIAPVFTFYTRSNHDEVTGYHLAKLIEAYFRNDNSVTVDTRPLPRKYFLLGCVLVGFGHGDKEGIKDGGTKDKASRLASCMPIEAPELWAKAKYREFHAAHLHSEQMIQEINGVIVRRISSPTATDTYHKQSGFLGAVRKAQTFIYHPTRGVVHIINTPVNEVE